jgi:predicted metalloprotease with PDZ domain
VQIELPDSWGFVTSETRNASNQFEVADTENAIFFVARNLRGSRGRAESLEYKFGITGNWAFSDEDVTNATEKILAQHEKTFKGAPHGQALIVIAPFPVAASGNMWSAETRGRTVLLLSGRTPAKTAALAQICVPLTHELMHLWVPNALALDGEYDWFYEGFTLYQAMRVGMRLEYLTFQDYLNALGHAFDNYKSARGAEEVSLLEASKRRWVGASALVYNKGMLVAFLYDLTLRSQSSGKLSLDDVYRELFRRSKLVKERRDGNAAVTEVLGSMGGMQDFTERYVQKAFDLNLQSAIQPFGLQVEMGGVRTRIAVVTSPGRAQRKLLGGLGYNESAKRKYPKREI